MGAEVVGIRPISRAGTGVRRARGGHPVVRIAYDSPVSSETNTVIRDRVRLLYEGRSRRARRFRMGLLAFDVAVVVFFVVTTFVHGQAWIIAVDYALGAVLLVDLAARWWIAGATGEFMTRPVVIVDIAVILSLLAPMLVENLAFLRVLRTLRLLRSYHVLKDLRRHSRFIARREEVIFSALNLVVFIFVVSALVYVLQVNSNAGIGNYMDALYFTVTTLTTTGFGDITLTGQAGRLLAVLIMIVGVGLFLRLLQTIFRPAKVDFECPECGLERHDRDAVHCKHCGHILHIATEGA